MDEVKIVTDENKVEDKNPAENDGTTPLHYAAGNGHWEVCQLIVDHVQDKNPRDDHGVTPLHLAAGNGHWKICQLIVDSAGDEARRILRSPVSGTN